MRLTLSLLLVATFAACRGEPVPRDYQNHPSTMTAPPASRTDTPAAHGLGQGSPEPSTGVEGTAGPYEPVNPPASGTVTTTIPDTPPATAT